MIIYKFPFLPRALMQGAEVAMPAEAKVLTVQMQGDVPCLWALVDENASLSHVRAFVIYGTGQPLPENYGEYVGTFQHGPYVWHLFEVKP